MSEADQYIWQEKDAIEFAQAHFSQLQERWEIDGKIDLETFKNWAKQKYAQDYLALALSARERMLKGQGVSQQALSYREPPIISSQPDLAAEVISDTPALLPVLPGGSVENALSRFYITPEHMRKHIRDYGGSIDHLASMDMQHHLSWHPDRLHAVRTIISGRMKDIRQGDVATIASEKALTHLRVLRDTLTGERIEWLLFFSGDMDFHIMLNYSRHPNIGQLLFGRLIGVSKRATIYFAMKHFDHLGEQHLRELSGMIAQRLASNFIEDTDPVFPQEIYNERLRLHMLQDAVADRLSLVLGQDPPPKSPFSLAQFYITADDINQKHAHQEGMAFVYKDLDELNQTELGRVQQVVSQKHAAVYEQSALELDASVDYEVALRRLEALKTAIAAKRRDMLVALQRLKELEEAIAAKRHKRHMLIAEEHLSIKERLVSQEIIQLDEAQESLDTRPRGGAEVGAATASVQKRPLLVEMLRMREGIDPLGDTASLEEAQKELQRLTNVLKGRKSEEKSKIIKWVQIDLKKYLKGLPKGDVLLPVIVQKLRLHRDSQIWEQYPTLMLLSRLGELKDLKVPTVSKLPKALQVPTVLELPKALGALEQGRADWGSDVIQVQQADLRDIEKIQAQAFHQNPKLINTLAQLEDKVIHPPSDQVVILYNGKTYYPYHTEIYKRIVSLGQDHKGQNVWIELETGG